MGRFSDAAHRAATETNAEYASRISGLTSLTDAQIKRLFPTHADKDKLVELMEIVNSATSENSKINRISGNIKHLGSTVIRLIRILS